MNLVPTVPETQARCTNELEALLLSDRQLDYLGRLSRELNPDMPAAMGLPHLIRVILDRVEQSGVDLTDASSEAEITRLAARQLRAGETASGSTPGAAGASER